MTKVSGFFMPEQLRVFFGLGVRIGHPDRAIFALALHGSRLTPSLAALRGLAGFVQDLPENIGTHLRQAIGGLTQGSLQCRERPRRSPILFPIRRASELFKDALFRDRIIYFGGSAPVTRFQR